MIDVFIFLFTKWNSPRQAAGDLFAGKNLFRGKPRRT